jgi:hypothetical protein
MHIGDLLNVEINQEVKTVTPRELLTTLVRGINKSSPKDVLSMNVLQILLGLIDQVENRPELMAIDGEPNAFHIRVPINMKNTRWMMKLKVSMQQIVR